MRFTDLDLAKVEPCPGCGTPTKVMRVPIAGTGTDLTFPDVAYCAGCLREKVDRACDGIEPSPGRRVIVSTDRLL